MRGISRIGKCDSPVDLGRLDKSRVSTASIRFELYGQRSNLYAYRLNEGRYFVDISIVHLGLELQGQELTGVSTKCTREKEMSE